MALRQRVLKNMAELSRKRGCSMKRCRCRWHWRRSACAACTRDAVKCRRRAAANRGIPFTLSTVSLCPIEEVAPAINRPMWFQLYVLRDRGFMRNALERAKAAGCSTLVFTVDMPTPRALPRCALRHERPACRAAPLLAGGHPSAVGMGRRLHGRPHDLGNISTYLGNPTGLEDYIGWLANNFDPSISWQDLEWIREFWEGPMVIKGILDPEDARDAVRFGADGIVVSNHGGRQLDGVLSSARALPAIADAVKGDITILADSGIRNGWMWCA